MKKYKTCKETRKCDLYTKGEKQPKEADNKWTQMLDFSKTLIFLKLFKELKENMTTMTQQIWKLNREIQILKPNRKFQNYTLIKAKRITIQTQQQI